MKTNTETMQNTDWETVYVAPGSGKDKGTYLCRGQRQGLLCAARQVGFGAAGGR